MPFPWVTSVAGCFGLKNTKGGTSHVAQVPLVYVHVWKLRLCSFMFKPTLEMWIPAYNPKSSGSGSQDYICPSEYLTHEV